MTLVDGVIQFGVCVAVFSANDKQFETFCEFRFIGFSLCQRRDFNGVVDDECRLNQVLFYEFFEEQVQDIAFYMTFFIFYMMFVSDSLCFCCISYLVEVYAGEFFNGVNHSLSCERFAQIQFVTAVNHFCGTQYVLRNGTEHFFCDVHHAVIVCVSLIQFHQGKFWVMTNGDTFVTEYTADFIHTFKTADDQTFQRQFQSDTAVHVDIQCVMVCDERSCGSAAGNGLQYRCFHFQEALAVQEFTDFCDDAGTFDECVTHFGVYDQVQISLTVTQFLVFQTVEFFGQYLQALGQQCHFFGVYGNFPCFCLEYEAFDADQVADVEFFECGISFIADVVTTYIRLDVAVSVLDVAEGRFPHDTFAHKSAGNGNVFAFQFVEVVFDFIAVMCYFAFCNFKGVFAFSLKLCQLFPSDFNLFAQFLLCHFLCRLVVLFCHFVFLRFRVLLYKK